MTNAVGDDALAALQRLRHLGGAEAPITFAQDEFGRADAAVLGDIERDHLGERLGIAMHAPERASAVRLGGPAPAGADRIDHHEIGESEPGVRVVGEANVRAVEAVAEHRDARTHEPEIEKSRARPGPAIEHERHRPRRIVGLVARLGNEGRIEDRGRTFAGLVEQRERAGRRRVGKLPGRGLDRMLGDGIGRQKGQHTRSILPGDVGIGDALFRARGSLRLARMFLRQRGKRENSYEQNGKASAKGHHCWCFLVDRTSIRRPRR